MRSEASNSKKDGRSAGGSGDDGNRYSDSDDHGDVILSIESLDEVDDRDDIVVFYGVVVFCYLISSKKNKNKPLTTIHE